MTLEQAARAVLSAWDTEPSDDKGCMSEEMWVCMRELRQVLMAVESEVPEVEVTSNLPTISATQAIEGLTRMPRRSAAKNVSSAHLQNAFISEARSAMGQPGEEEAVSVLGRVVKITFNVDKPPVSGKLTRVINHPSSAPTYVILDDDDNVPYPLASIQNIEVIE